MTKNSPVAILTGTSRRPRRGLIVFTSASGAAHYSMGPSYGAHKAAMDKMAFDLAVDFRDGKMDVSSVSIWMGALATDRRLAMIEADPDSYGYLRDQLETPEFTGHVVWAPASVVSRHAQGRAV